MDVFAFVLSKSLGIHHDPSSNVPRLDPSPLTVKWVGWTHPQVLSSSNSA